MKISISSDHGAYDLKEFLKEKLGSDYEIIDHGCFSKESCDYPIYASKVAMDIRDKMCDLGIVLCTNGIGVSIVANKYKGVRCALCLNTDMAYHAKTHNDANCLSLGSTNQSFSEALEIAKIFLNTSFSNEERHTRRVNQIKNIEENNL